MGLCSHALGVIETEMYDAESEAAYGVRVSLFGFYGLAIAVKGIFLEYSTTTWFPLFSRPAYCAWNPFVRIFAKSGKGYLARRLQNQAYK